MDKLEEAMKETDNKGVSKEVLAKLNSEDFQKALINLAAYGAEIGKQIRSAVEAYQDFVHKNAPQIAAVIQSIQEIPSDFLAIQQVLSKRGWFVLGEMPAGDFRSLITLIDASNFDELDNTMAAWTSLLLDETEAKLFTEFPDRAALLKEGFDNHRNGRYASAITLLLTQADGICFDVLQEIFFKTRQISGGAYVPKVKDKIDALGVDAFAEITLHPILILAGINASREQILNGDFPDSPHRHPILHGADKDYPSELNSLKVISLVGYLGGVVNEIVKEASGVTATSAP